MLAHAPASFASSPEYCSAHPHFFREAWQQGSTPAAVADFAREKQRLQVIEARLTPCSDPMNKLVANAYFTALVAAIGHAHGLPYEDALNAAIQDFSRCESDLYGTWRSAECQTDLGVNVRRKIEWGAEAMRR